MKVRKDYCLRLLEDRANRLQEFLEVCAPPHIICREVRLILEAAYPLEPEIFDNPSLVPGLGKREANEGQLQGELSFTG